MEQELGGLFESLLACKTYCRTQRRRAVVIADAVNSHSKSGFRQRFFRSTMASSASSVPSDCSHSPTKDAIFTITQECRVLGRFAADLTCRSYSSIHDSVSRSSSSSCSSEEFWGAY